MLPFGSMAAMVHLVLLELGPPPERAWPLGVGLGLALGPLPRLVKLSPVVRALVQGPHLPHVLLLLYHLCGVPEDQLPGIGAG